VKNILSILVYALSTLLAGYASYSLVTELGQAYHFGALAQLSAGVLLFGVLASAVCGTVAAAIQSLIAAPRYSWYANIVRIVGFAGGIAAASLAMWDVLYGDESWKTAVEFLFGFVGVYAYAHVSVFATDATSEIAPG
jgi:hypothetical protein